FMTMIFQSGKSAHQTIEPIIPETDIFSDERNVFTSFENPPVPVGRFDEFYKYIAENANFSKEAYAEVDPTDNHSILVKFTVEIDGSLSHIEKVKDLGHGSFEEVKRLLENAPKWKPGTHNTHLVRVQ